MPEAHSKYGASSAHRWLNCPGSIQLSETVPKQSGSKYALEGTAAHKLGELCLNKGSWPEHYVDQNITLDDGSEYLVTEEMAEAVTVYVEYVREQEKLGESFIETRFSLDFIHEGMFGTNDACVYSELLGVLEVIDYKHGAGIAVSPEENTQLAYYGLGAAEIHDLHPESQIKLTIVQPRAMGEPIKSWTTTVGYLEKYAKTLRKGVKACQAKKPKLAEGDWCRFCPAQAVCPQLEKKALEVAKAEFASIKNYKVFPTKFMGEIKVTSLAGAKHFKVEASHTETTFKGADAWEDCGIYLTKIFGIDEDDLSDFIDRFCKHCGVYQNDDDYAYYCSYRCNNEADAGITFAEPPKAIVLPEPNDLNIVDIKRVLDFSGVLSSWLKAVESYALNELERGQSIEGYKLVKKRANRKWAVEEEEVINKAKEAGHEYIHLTTVPKLKSPAQIEKLVGKELVASLCETPDNGNTMVPVSDKRPEVVPSIQSDFAPVTAEELG